MKREFEMNERDLDRQLSSAAQKQVHEVVKALPEETLSLAWRSELNTRLRNEIVHKKRVNLFGWVWKPAAGVALAGALAVGFFFRTPEANLAPPSGGIENALVNHYVDSTASWEVAGDGATVGDTKDSAPANSVPVDNDQEDVGAIL